MTRLDVEIAALDAHGRKIGDAADRIGEVSAAALQSITLGPQAFGLICSFLVPVVMTQQAAALAAMNAISAAVRAEGAAIGVTAAGYRAADSELAHKIAELLDLDG